MPLTISIGSDHAGFLYKEAIKAHLQAQGHTVLDFGTTSTASCDYPKFVRPAAEAVVQGQSQRGIVLGGSGNGEAIVANKVKGIRCAVCFSLDTARWAKAHNDANVISIGERTVTKELALQIVDTWLATEFEGGRHVARIAQIEPA